MENWMRTKRFQLSVGPRGKSVYHRSPSGRKVVLAVPNSVMTKNNAVRFLSTPRLTVPKYVPGPNHPLDCAVLKHLSNFKKIGSGRQGVIYAGNRRPTYVYNELAIKVAPFDLSAEIRKEKQPAQVEYDIHSAVQRVSSGILTVVNIVQCKDFVPSSDLNVILGSRNRLDRSRQAVIFMRRANGGTLREWLAKNAEKTTDAQLMGIVTRVLRTLYNIMKEFPEFRHNDLHLDNILMNNNEPLIADFGWARIKKRGTNPAVNTALENGTAAQYGIGPDTESIYDAYLFLNEMRKFAVKASAFPKTLAFLNKCIPEKYREFSGVYTSEGRLRYRADVSGLPTLRQMLSEAKVKLSPSPPKSRALSAPPPKARVPSPPKARALSASPPKARVPSPPKTRNFLTMSPRSFLKLSPKTKARAISARKGAKRQLVSPKRQRANNATARRMPSPKRIPSPPKVRISPRVLRSNAFNRLVVSLLNMNNSKPYQNRWNAARNKAMNQLVTGKTTL